MIISSGCILQDKKSNLILVLHSCGKKFICGTYDIAKGKVEPSEDHFDTMLREVKEETSIVLSSERNKYDDLGLFDYVKGKRLHLYYTKQKFLPDYAAKNLKCTTYFAGTDGKDYPEVNAFSWVPKSKLNLYLFPSLYNVIKEVEEILDD